MQNSHNEDCYNCMKTDLYVKRKLSSAFPNSSCCGVYGSRFAPGGIRIMCFPVDSLSRRQPPGFLLGMRLRTPQLNFHGALMYRIIENTSQNSKLNRRLCLEHPDPGIQGGPSSRCRCGWAGQREKKNVTVAVIMPILQRKNISLPHEPFSA